MPAWTPPAGFAQRVAASGADMIQTRSASARWWSPLRAVTAGALAAIGACAAGYSVNLLITSLPTVASPAAVTWIWVAFAYGAAGLATRRT
jgi:hypothetical protein